MSNQDKKPHRCYWTADTVKQEIFARHNAGMPLQYGIVKSSAATLIIASRKFYGSYRAAVEACGIEYPSAKIGRPRKSRPKPASRPKPITPTAASMREDQQNFLVLNRQMRERRAARLSGRGAF